MTERIVSHYRITSRLGSGGMGVVWKAEDTRLGRPVVLKFVRQQYSERFEREARALAALNHPGICTVHDVGTYDGRPYLVMEFLEGETLRERIRAGAPPVDDVLDYAVQLAGGLDAAHSKGIIHRDIKPANVFITRRGQIKILDFGLAKQSTPSLEAEADDIPTQPIEAADLTTPGHTIGTAAYMSPEQARGEEVDARSDLFSSGVVLYELAAGVPPFRGATAAVVFAELLGSDPQPLGELRPELPAELERIVARLLAKNRDQRYATAHELLLDLRRLQRSGESGSGSQSLAVAARTRRPISRRWVAAALLPVAAAAAYFGFVHTRPIRSLAVLPFRNLAGNPDMDYLGDGLTDALINNLSQTPGLKVMARSAVDRYRDRNVDPGAVGRELNVQAVLTGRVAQRGSDITFSAELVSVRDNSTLWGESYHRQLSDLQSLQTEMAQAIALRLRLQLAPASGVPRRTANPEAYQDYLRGRYHWNRRTGEDIGTSIRYFEQAAAKDPSYARAWAGLAQSYAILSEYRPVAPKETFPKAMAAARRAVELDDSLAEAHAAIGFVKEAYEWDWTGSERAFQKALALNPGYATAHHWYGLMLLRAGRVPEAVASVRRALDLDPLSLIINDMTGINFVVERRYDAGIAQFRKTLALDPHFAVAHQFLGWTLLCKGMPNQAFAELDQATKNSSRPDGLAMLGYAYAVAGRRADAEKVMARMRDLSTMGYFPAWAFGMVHVALGNLDQSFAEFAGSADAGEMYFLLQVDPLLDPLRRDARYRALLRRLNLAR